MVKLLLVLFALCVVPSIVSARRQKPLVVRGNVYCEACRADFETSAAFPVPGATVEAQCRLRDDASNITFSQTAVTDYSGNYLMFVHGDIGSNVFCDMMLVNSPMKECTQVDPNRGRSRVILTRNNGMATNERCANSLGFLRETPLANCAEVMKQYEDTEADD